MSSCLTALAFGRNPRRRGTGIAVVFVHRGPGLWDYLGPVAAMVEDLAITHRFDQRGCGRSAGEDGYNMRQLVADLEALRMHWGHQRWVVFGHSFGASVALEYGYRHPDVVAGLVYCSGVGFGRRWHDEYRRTSTGRLTARQLSRRTELGHRARSWQEEVEWRQLSWLPDYVDTTRAEEWSLDDASVELPINVNFHQALNGEVNTEDEQQQRARCHAVTSRALVLLGAGDPRPMWSAAEVADALPRAELVVVPEAGHNPWREQPALTRKHVRTFVEAVGTSQPEARHIDNL